MDFTRLQNYMDRLVKEYNTPGVDCLVYKGHEQIFRYYTGMSDEENNKKMVGKTITVLCEDFDPVSEAHFGRSANDAPEIDGKVYFKSDVRIAPGSFVEVKVREVIDYDLYGFAVLPKTN